MRLIVGSLVINRLTIAAAGLGMLIGGAPPARAAATFDRPLAEQTISAPGPGGDPDRALKIHCATYATFMVRDVHEGGDIGTSSVSVLPLPSSAPATCAARNAPDAKELPGFGSMEVMGAVGRFLLLIWPDGGNGATSFAVFDTVSLRKLYTDVVKLDGFTRVAAGTGGDTLELAFVRVVPLKCSVVTGGAACWSQSVREAKLPGEIARRPPPNQACATAYAHQTGPVRAPPDDPSVVAYDVSMTLSASGTATVRSRGALSCWPSE